MAAPEPAFVSKGREARSDIRRDGGGELEEEDEEGTAAPDWLKED